MIEEKQNNLEIDTKVSIIIPAFNVEEDISRCLDSVVKQTYENIEIIIVNDASTDNTESIINEYMQKDSRIVCVTKEENEGLLQARMTGIKKATGDYIYSVDSDDYVMLDLVKETLEEALTHNADIVQFPMKLQDNDKKYSSNWTIKNYREYNKDDFFLHNGNSWTIMFKKELGTILNKYIGSLSVNYHEDYIISIILSAFYKKVRYIDKAYYVYCDTDTSMTRQYSEEALLKYICDTFIFIVFMKNLLPKIYSKEKFNYFFTLVFDRINSMKHQLEKYFKESEKVSIYDLYNNTNGKKIFILYSILYNVIEIKDQSLQQKDEGLKVLLKELKESEVQEKNKIIAEKQNIEKQLNDKNQELEDIYKSRKYKFACMVSSPYIFLKRNLSLIGIK